MRSSRCWRVRWRSRHEAGHGWRPRNPLHSCRGSDWEIGGMNRGGAIFVACLLAAAFLWAALDLMGVRFATGDIYPEYSSLRSDAMGSKLLYDSLARLPGLSVSRTYAPLDLIEGTAQTVMVLGTPPSSMDAM